VAHLQTNNNKKTKDHSKWIPVKSALPFVGCTELQNIPECNVNICLRGMKSCFVQARSPRKNVDRFILHTFDCKSVVPFSVCVILCVVF